MMAAAGVDGNDETYEWLANAAVRSVDFVTVRDLFRAVVGWGCCPVDACVCVCVLFFLTVMQISMLN